MQMQANALECKVSASADEFVSMSVNAHECE